jgi:glutaredoxin
MITLYSKPDCPYSRALRRKLRKENRQFQDRDITADSKILEDMLVINGGVPHTPTWIDETGTIIVGFHGH